jgi:hypothetical protein
MERKHSRRRLMVVFILPAPMLIVVESMFIVSIRKIAGVLNHRAQVRHTVNTSRGGSLLPLHADLGDITATAAAVRTIMVITNLAIIVGVDSGPQAARFASEASAKNLVYILH